MFAFVFLVLFLIFYCITGTRLGQYLQFHELEILDELIESKHSSENYIRRGDIYNGMRKEKLALADYSAAIAVDPTCTLGYIYRGRYLNDINRYDEAISDFQKAIELDPSCAAAYAGRCTSFYRLNKCELALTDSDIAVALDPDMRRHCGISRVEDKTTKADSIQSHS